MSADWYTDKKILALLRGGDYAHAGEESAIELVFKDIPKSKDRDILDVGCGLGGTAQFIQKSGWGKVIGLDKDQLAIDYAEKKYPQIEFYAGDVVDAAKILSPKRFDLICLFNVFFAFSDPVSALGNLAQLSKPGAQLIIFDYVDWDEKGSSIKNELLSKTFSVVNAKELGSMLPKGWKIEKSVNLNKLYRLWYQKLIEKIKNKKSEMIQKFGEELYLKTLTNFSDLYALLDKELLGGGVFYIKNQN